MTTKSSLLSMRFMRLIALLCLMALFGVACPKPVQKNAPPLPSPTAQEPDEPEPDDNGGTLPKPSRRPQIPDEPAEEPPASGGLEDFVQKDIGDFSLVDSARAETFVTNLGAIDALALLYEDGGGNQVLHNMAVFEKAQQAVDVVNGIGGVLIEETGYELVDSGEINGDDGSQIGFIAILQKENAGVVLWSIGNIFLSAESESGEAVGAFVSAFFGG
ncbi:MAG TPA: hypothetical protein VND22_01065 [Actinomycetota bacterium]|nr:hypothetical protein [Actinomycetota bacterium]